MPIRTIRITIRVADYIFYGQASLMHNVFIFGAGASKQCGGPLMSEFLEQARGLYREDPNQPGSAAFKEVFEAIPDLQQIHMKSYLDLDNLEVLFGAIEMAQLLNKLPGRTGEDISRLRDLGFCVCYELRDSLTDVLYYYLHDVAAAAAEG